MFRVLYIDDLVKITAEYNDTGNVFLHADVIGNTEGKNVKTAKRIVLGTDEAIEVLKSEGHTRVFALVPHSNTKAQHLAELNGFIPIVKFPEVMLYDQEI